MIKTKNQYATTLERIAEMEKSKAAFIQQHPDQSSPESLFGISSFDAILEDLRTEANAFEKLSSGGFMTIQPQSLAEVPLSIIQARIALGLSQTDFA
jgi:hypothetical protein